MSWQKIFTLAFGLWYALYCAEGAATVFAHADTSSTVKLSYAALILLAVAILSAIVAYRMRAIKDLARTYKIIVFGYSIIALCTSFLRQNIISNILISLILLIAFGFTPRMLQWVHKQDEASR